MMKYLILASIIVVVMIFGVSVILPGPCIPTSQTESDDDKTIFLEDCKLLDPITRIMLYFDPWDPI